MLKTTVPLVVLVLSFLCAAPHSAFSASPDGKTCPVIGLKNLRLYVLNREVTCFASSKRAEVKKFALFDESIRSTKVFKGKSGACAYLGVKPDQVYIPAGLTTCLQTAKAAKKKGYLRYKRGTLPAATPTPTPSPTLTPTATATLPPQTTATPTGTSAPDPTPTPLPPGDPLPYKVQLGHNGLPVGQCTGTLSGDRKMMALDCTHTTDAKVAHIHFLPENVQYCIVNNPGPSFHIDCEITPDHLGVLQRGKMLVTVESFLDDPDPDGQGYVLPA